MFRDLKEYQEIAKIYADRVSKPEDLEERRGANLSQDQIDANRKGLANRIMTGNPEGKRPDISGSNKRAQLSKERRGDKKFEFKKPISGSNKRAEMSQKRREMQNKPKPETDSTGKPTHRGSGKDLSYFDDVKRERFVPHVIEPSAGADRAVLAFLCDAYHEDSVPDDGGNARKRTFLKLHPRLAPIKAAVLPLVKKDGMPEVAIELYKELKPHMTCMYDEKSSVGRRYARQDEAGTPWCLTVDGQTLKDKTVTLRDRDSLSQERVPIDDVVSLLKERLS